MLFNEFNFPFMVMVTMLGYYVNSLSNDIPICEPPALRCSVFKRSVCEWSDSGEPVWACRGYFETVNNEPKRPQQKSTDVTNAAQHDSESEVILGTYEYQIPQGNSKAVLQHESLESDVKYVTYPYPVETGPNVQNGTYTLPLSSDKSIDVAHDDSKSDAHIKSNANHSPTRKNSSGSEEETDVTAHIDTYTLPVIDGSKTDEATHTESESNVQSGTFTAYHIPSSTTKSSSRVESVIGSKNGEAAKSVKSNSDVFLGTYTHHVPSDRKSSSSQMDSQSNLQLLVTHTSDISSRNSSDILHSVPESSSLTGTISVSSGKSNVSSHSDSKVNVQFGAYELLSGRNIVAAQDDSESKVHAAANANQAGMRKSEPQVSAGVKILTATNVNSTSSLSDLEPQIEIHAQHLDSASRTSSQSKDRRGSNTHYEVPISGSIIGSLSNYNTQLGPYYISSGTSSAPFPNTNSEGKFKLGMGSIVQSVANNKTHGEATQINQASDIQQGLQQTPLQMNNASHLSSSRATSHQGSQTNGLGLVNSGLYYTPSTGLGTNWGTHQQLVAGYSNVFNAKKDHSQFNGYAGPVHATGTYGQTAGAPFIGGERTLGGDYGYSGTGSHISDHQASSIGSTVFPYLLNSGSNANGVDQQQYHSNSAAGPGSTNQKYVSVTQNKFPLSYPCYGSGGYRSSEKSSSASTTQSASSGSGLHWHMGLGGAGYGAHWLVGHNTPLLNLGLNGFVEPQSTVTLSNSGFYRSRNLNPGSGNSATSTSLSSRSNPWSYVFPFSQYATNRGLDTSDIDLHSCFSCKKLMSVYGGAAICDALEPIILEFFSKVLEIFRKRLK